MVTDNDARNAIATLLRYLGEDPTRDGLKDTPERVIRAWKESTSGYWETPEKHLSRVFDLPSDEMIVVRGIRFYSTCEHHLLPFHGEAVVAYIPGDRVVGLSKLARVVDIYARRLQCQERMTDQIAQAIEEWLQPRGVGVLVRAHHLCMGCRGVKQPASEMVTSSTLGAMRNNPAARTEWLNLAK